MPTRSRAVIAASLAAIAFLTTSCDRSDSLDVAGLEAELKRRYEDEYDTRDLTVTCPDDVKVAAGSTFECEATQPNGATLVITVTQTDDQGNVRVGITGASN